MLASGYTCNPQLVMIYRRILFTFAALLTMLAASGQCRFYHSYEDFVDGRWSPLDTLFVSGHSKNHQLWWGGNDYTLRTGRNDLDRTLKKNALIVVQADTLYVNCRNLRFDGTSFGNGYTKAMRIGNRSILLVNRLIGREAMRSQWTASFMFGAIGAAITAGKNVKQQVCYVISNGADSRGRINIRLIDDELMGQMLEGHNELLEEYLSEQDVRNRLQATHIVPILERAGLFGNK